MSRKANPTLIGAFVLGGVLLAVIAVVVFGSGRMFRPTETFMSFFDGSVAGLNVGASRPVAVSDSVNASSLNRTRRAPSATSSTLLRGSC